MQPNTNDASRLIRAIKEGDRTAETRFLSRYHRAAMTLLRGRSRRLDHTKPTRTFTGEAATSLLKLLLGRRDCKGHHVDDTLHGALSRTRSQ